MVRVAAWAWHGYNNYLSIYCCNAVMSAGLTFAILRLGQRKAWHSSCPAPTSVSEMKENTWSQVGSAMQYEILGMLLTLRNTDD